MLYPGLGISGDLRTLCIERSGVDCTANPCDPEHIPSRTAQPDGAGGCRYADECSFPEDCVRAFAATECCACFEAMPRALVEAQPCLLIEGDVD